MSLQKSASIRALVASLDLEGRGWILQDHWGADLRAIGIALGTKPRQLVYISTFGRSEGRFDYECEVPGGSLPEEYVVTASGTDVDFERLMAVLCEHLSELPPSPPRTDDSP